MAEYKVEFSEQDLANLKALVARTGKTANAIIADALSNAKLIDDNIAPTDDLLIKKGEKFLKVTLRK